MRLNVFSPGQLMEMRTPLHKARHLGQLSLSRDTGRAVLLYVENLIVLIASFLSECSVVMNSKEKTVKMCSGSCDTCPVSCTVRFQKEQIVL